MAREREGEADAGRCFDHDEKSATEMEKRVLIVDDETAILFGFKRLIQRDGVVVDTAETVEEAVSLMGKREYHFIITDLKLSGSSSEGGFEVLRHSKTYKPGAKIILVTGYGTPEVMEKALAEGASCYYEKPVSAATLREALKKLGL
ncbi:MAG TPA: response regulator [Syntrophorhabdaceae bacterium]